MPHFNNSLLRDMSFLLSATNMKQLPEDVGCEVAFVGKSNAGKSSAINMLCEQKKLARTSKTPGCTQSINCFTNNTSRVIDLPGYGYAKVSRTTQRTWQKTVNDYLIHRQSLQALCIMVDIRRGIGELDIALAQWANNTHKQIHILLTKSDKLGFGAAKNTLYATETALKNYQIEAQTHLFSSHNKTGVVEVQHLLHELLSP